MEAGTHIRTIGLDGRLIIGCVRAVGLALDGREILFVSGSDGRDYEVLTEEMVDG